MQAISITSIIFTLFLLTGCDDQSLVSEENVTPQNGTAEVIVPIETLEQYKEIEIECSSINFKKQKCKLPKGTKGFVDSVELIEQYSQSICELEESFGKKGDRAIYVKEGCRGKFKVKILANGRKKKSKNKNNWKHTTVTAFDLGDFDNMVEVGDSIAIEDGTGVVSTHTNGIGVNGGSPVPPQINHDPVTGKSEALVFELPDYVYSVKIMLSNLYKNEGSGERAGYLVLNESKEVVEKGILDATTLKYKKNSQHEATVKFDIQGKYIVLYALEYDDRSSRPNDSSDFYVRYISFKYLISE